MTTETLTLTDFLLARIAEDETVEYERTAVYHGHSEPLRVRASRRHERAG